MFIHDNYTSWLKRIIQTNASRLHYNIPQYLFVISSSLLSHSHLFKISLYIFRGVFTVVSLHIEIDYYDIAMWRDPSLKHSWTVTVQSRYIYIIFIYLVHIFLIFIYQIFYITLGYDEKQNVKWKMSMILCIFSHNIRKPTFLNHITMYFGCNIFFCLYTFFSWDPSPRKK